MGHDELEEQAAGAERFAEGGYLSKEGRAAAIRSAIPLVGRYFKKSGIPELETSSRLSHSAHAPNSDRRLMAALRFRAALSVAENLYLLIEKISMQPTFRYELEAIESTDLTGSLDLSRWVHRKPVFEGEPRYPMLSARRAAATPENILASYAGLWILDELRLAQSGARPPSKAPEVAVADHLRGRFRQILARPVFRECHRDAAEVLRRGHVKPLLERVDIRLRRREISHSEPYQALFDLIVQYRENGPDAAEGMQPWSFYDKGFDPTLFEIWCLHALAVSIADSLAAESPVVGDDWAGSGLAYSWGRPSGELRLYSQNSLANLGKYSRSPQWKTESQGSLGGIPDITVVADPLELGAPRIAIIDAKLRQRERVPTEELYKVLGYFNNFKMDDSPIGIIFYYSPTVRRPRIYRYENEEAVGKLLAVELNPADPAEVERAMKPVAELLLGMLGMPALAPARSDGGNSELESAIAQHLAEMRGISVQLSPQSLESSRRRMRTLLGDGCWHVLGTESQTMLATSDHVGFFLEPNADFSGPVLGLCTALEAAIHEKIVQPARDRAPDDPHLLRTNTIGQVLSLVERSLSGAIRGDAAAVRDTFDEANLDIATLGGLLPELWAMNNEFRIPAAHKERLTEAKWNTAFGQIVSGNSLLGRLVNVLYVGG